MHCGLGEEGGLRAFLLLSSHASFSQVCGGELGVEVGRATTTDHRRAPAG